MFFLHDLDLNRRICLPPVLRKDDLGVLKTLGVNLRKRKTDRSLYQDLPTETFPLGEAPSWNDVARCIKEQPWRLMRPWLWSDNLGHLNQTACRLFKQFTTHIWTCLNSKWRTSQDPIHPTSLQDVIKCWTLDEVHARIKSVSFIPGNADLLGHIRGRRIPSFADRQSLYFPATSTGLVGYWKLLSMNPGYIAEYQEICKRLSGDQVSDLNSDLSTLLSECQCLPLSIRNSENGNNTRQVIWKVHKQDILVLTNPSFYKLVRISDTLRRADPRAPPAHTPKRSLQISLLEQDGVSTDVARRAVNWSRALQKQNYDQTHRTGRANNRRVPPPRKKQLIQQENGSESEEEEEEEEEEGEEYEEEDYEEGEIYGDD
jgi:ribosomal protein L12E/L44/L45/RPP1/RPP2